MKMPFYPTLISETVKHTVRLQYHHLLHAVFLQFLRYFYMLPTIFNHLADNPKMILNWLKSIKPCKRVCISLRATRTP